MATPTQSTSSLRRYTRRALRITSGILIVFVVLLVGIAAWLVIAGRGALPQLDGKLTIPGLRAPVKVARDAQGVPHISAASLDDLFLAQGYVTAQDRLWQMDMARRYAAGRLSEILGPKYVKVDVRQRTLLIPMLAQKAAASLDSRDRQYMEAYAKGVNAYITSHMNNLPLEFRVLHYSPQPWTVVDSMLVGASMSEMLNIGQVEDALDREIVTAKLFAQVEHELGHEELSANLAPQLAEDLYPNSSFRDHPPGQDAKPDGFNASPTPDDSDATPSGKSETRSPQRRRRSIRHLTPRNRRVRRSRASLKAPVIPEMEAGPLYPGSNNWVVSGVHTVSGRPLLSNDMHLPHQIPNLWYEVQLTSGNFDVAGVSLPGMPFVIVGHNRRIAWGFTNIDPDVTELYIEKFNDKGEYLTPDGWKKPEYHEEDIHVRWGRDVKLNVTVTRHGPIVSSTIPGEKRMLALRWILQDPAAFQNPFFDVDAATNWDQFRQAFARFGSPGQNVVYADADGHIGYQATGMVPLRPWLNSDVTGQQAGAQGETPEAGKEPSTGSTQEKTSLDQAGLPVSGWDNSHEWAGYIPFDKLPSVYDPPSGIIATANGRITPDGYPYLISAEWGSAYRTERIYRVLNEDRKFSPSDMLKLQTDVYSDFDRFCAERFAYAIDHAPDASKRAKQAADILRNWDGTVDVDSVAATIVARSRAALIKMLLQPKLGDETSDYHWFMSSVWLENVLLQHPPEWLPAEYTGYNQLLAAAVEKTLENAPRDLNTWRWGTVSKVSIQHPLFGAIPILDRWAGTGTLPQSGDGYTVKQVGTHFGPSERMTVDFSDFDHSTLNTVTGQSGNLFSPYYLDQWQAWYEGRTFDLPFSAEAVNKGAQHELTLEPGR